MEELFKLNEEQVRVLDEIAEKMREFYNIGGRIFWDCEGYELYTINAANTEELFDAYRHDINTDEYLDVTGFLSRAPFSIDSVAYDDNVWAKLKYVNKNLF